MNFELLRRKLHSKALRLESLRLRMEDLRVRSEELKAEVASIPELLETLQQLNQFVQTRTFTYFEDIVNKCLRAIFPNPYTFKIVPEVKRKQFEVRFELHKNGEIFDPNTEVECGVLDVASFALRIAFLSLKPVRRLLIMDEPFKWVGASNRVRIPALLEALSKDLGFQIILVTHLQELINDDAIILTELPGHRKSSTGKSRKGN